jgi:hypothetical protein
LIVFCCCFDRNSTIDRNNIDINDVVADVDGTINVINDDKDNEDDDELDKKAAAKVTKPAAKVTKPQVLTIKTNRKKYTAPPKTPKIKMTSKSPPGPKTRSRSKQLSEALIPGTRRNNKRPSSTMPPDSYPITKKISKSNNNKKKQQNER